MLFKFFREVLLKILIYLLITAGLVFLYIKYLEVRSIFFPVKALQINPAYIGLSFKDIHLKTADKVDLHGWFIPYDRAGYTLLFFHGNGGNIAQRLEKILLLRQAKINIFIIDYRGYGNSSGKPSEKGVYLDARAAYNYLVNEYNITPEQIILYGESLGAAIAIDLGSQVPLRALILEGAFSNGRDIGKRVYPFIPKFILPNIFNSLGKIKKVMASQLFIHSKDDEVVPFELGKKLYRAASEPKQFIEILGGHNTAFIDSKGKYIAAIVAFIDGLK